jgi:hypothetical protein
VRKRRSRVVLGKMMSSKAPSDMSDTGARWNDLPTRLQLVTRTP